MKQILRKMRIGLSTAMALLLAASLATIPAKAEENRVPDLENTSSSITVTFAADNKTVALTGAVFCIDKVADLEVHGGGAFYTLTKDYEDTGITFDGMSVDNADQAAKTFYGIAKAKENQSFLTGETDRNGSCTFSDLTPGAYLVWEETTNNGTAQGYSLCNPFLLFAPEYDSSSASWKYQVASYPKSEVTKKNSGNSGGNNGGGSDSGGSKAAAASTHSVRGAKRSFTVSKEVLMNGQSVDGMTVPAGSSVVYRIRVSNNMGEPQDVEFGDALQDGITFVSTASPNFVQDGNSLHWKLSAVPDGGDAYVEFTAKLPEKAGTYSNSAYVLVGGVTQQTNEVTCTISNTGSVKGANREKSDSVPETGTNAASRQTSDDSKIEMYVLMVIAGMALLIGTILSKKGAGKQ